MTTLGDLSKNPDNAEKQAELKGELKYLLKSNPEKAKNLEELLKQIPTNEIKQNTINITGDDNITAQDVSGTVNINK